jgi:sialic acid synthase SpsE
MNRPELIAEIGKTHEGDIEKAKESIRLAKDAGFDSVKFQSYSLNDLNPKHVNFQRNLKCWLSLNQLLELKLYADDFKLKFYCSAFSTTVIEPLSRFTDRIKIPSTYVNNYKFVNKCNEHFEEVHVSNGMGIPHVYDAMDGEYYHCVSNYPTCPEQANMNMNKRGRKIVGYSDHTEGTLAMLIASIQGVRYIECHFNPFSSKKAWEKSQMDILMLSGRIDLVCRMMQDTDISEQQKEAYEFYKTEFKTLGFVK